MNNNSKKIEYYHTDKDRFIELFNRLNIEYEIVNCLNTTHIYLNNGNNILTFNDDSFGRLSFIYG